jgi:hypothetical protein
MRARVDALLEGEPHEWEVVDVDSDDELARRWSDRIPVLFVDDTLFATVKLPALEARARLLRAAGQREGGPT